ncbi:DUF4403 family protein [Sphingomonas sp. TWP1-3-1]|uniref:DUF4403 family protein n=1 Tax=Sphingomonas sp. TWP1-3-1 TaxID=2804612 RepID=UPI003CF2E3C7
MKVTVRAVHCYVSGDRLALASDIKVNFTGSCFDSAGKLYLTVKPVVDAKQSHIYASDYRITSKRCKTAVDVATLIANAAPVKRRILKAFDYRAQPDLDKAIARANIEIAKLSLPAADVQASIDSLKVSDVRLWNEQLVVVAEAYGKVAIFPRLAP